MYKGGKLVPTSLDLYLALEYCDQGVSAERECARVCVCVSLGTESVCMQTVCVCTGGNAHLCVSVAVGGSC